MMRSSRLRRGLLLGTMGFGCVLVGAATAVFGDHVTWIDVVLLGFVVICVALARLNRARIFDLLDPAFSWGLLFLGYTIPGSSNVGLVFGSPVTGIQWVLSLVAFGLFLLGCVSGRSIPLLRLDSRSVDWNAAWRASLVRRNVVLAVGLFAMVWSFAASGIPILGEVDAQRLTLRSPLGLAWPYALHLVVVAAMASIILAASPGVDKAARWRGGLAAAVSSTALILTGSRSFFVPIVIVGVVSAILLRRRLRVGSVVVMGIALLLGLSAFASYRSSTQAGGSTALRQELVSIGVSEDWMFLGSAFLSSLNGPHALAKAMRVIPTSVPFQRGRMLLGEVGTFLPGHQLLPDQWVAINVIGTTPIQLTGGVTWAGQAGGIPPGVLGGFYVDFGVAGILVGMFGVGMILSWLYRLTLAHPSVLAIALYGSAFAYFAVCIYSFVSVKPVQVWELIVLMFVFWPLRGVAVQIPGSSMDEVR